ncbi:MAG: 4-(cytidine 5'-diphospho)-2-C-methyl-D-erythritol kinase [Clostridiales bacterium]|jgi:4-diphosphocytidyl-2-C-methyl-D-erythritol kinase|nr:4-(cytidine 5'-diphospho)-2-C-methyl-D-erythritol kinase [Clostridiales bacterium]
MKTTVKAAAKINLHLDIVSTLPNGYHSLFMIMQSVGLYDTVTVEKAPKGIEITCSAPEIPTDKTNIAFKACKAFFEATGIRGGAKIHIEKHIPHAAGLAGGSADGAAVIAALNRIYETKLTDFELCRVGIKVGADVPFCLTGGTRLSQDIGGVLSPLPPIGEMLIVLAKPECSVSTKEAYQAFEKCEYVRHPNNAAVLHAAANSNFGGICKNACNVFEQFVEVAERVEIKRIMREHNSLMCLMSGSGPTVFGVFDNEADALACAGELRQPIGEVYVCRTVTEGLSLD